MHKILIGNYLKNSNIQGKKYVEIIYKTYIVACIRSVVSREKDKCKVKGTCFVTSDSLMDKEP